MRPQFIPWLSLTALALTLAACGKDEPVPPPPPPSPNWVQITWTTDCDRNPPSRRDRLFSLLPEESAASSTSTELRILNERMESGALRCEGAGAPIVVTRNGHYILPNGRSGNLTIDRTKELVAAGDEAFRLPKSGDVSCDRTLDVKDDEEIQGADGKGNTQILYTSDAQGSRRCFGADTEAVQRLRRALQPLLYEYQASGANRGVYDLPREQPSGPFGNPESPAPPLPENIANPRRFP